MLFEHQTPQAARAHAVPESVHISSASFLCAPSHTVHRSQQPTKNTTVGDIPTHPALFSGMVPDILVAAPTTTTLGRPPRSAWPLDTQRAACCARARESLQASGESVALGWWASDRSNLSIPGPEPFVTVESLLFLGSLKDTSHLEGDGYVFSIY